jgi:indolepyruvate ferredoxin oxidoreductase beta subunit
VTQTNVLLAGVGGQGVVTAGMLMGYAVTSAGLNAVMSEIHGMSQRGGVVLAELRIGEVHGPIIPRGEADLLLGFEAVETLRALNRATKDTAVITSMERVVPFTVNVGDAKYPDVEPLMRDLVNEGVRLCCIDAPMLAREAGNALASNVVLVGAAFAAGFVPVERGVMEKAIRTLLPPKSAESNLKAFDLGVVAYRNPAARGVSLGRSPLPFG